MIKLGYIDHNNVIFPDDVETLGVVIVATRELLVKLEVFCALLCALRLHLGNLMRYGL